MWWTFAYSVLSHWTFLGAAVLYLLWRKIATPYKFFSDRGIAYKESMPIVGNFGRVVLYKESIFDICIEDYKEFAGKR